MSQAAVILIAAGTCLAALIAWVVIAERLDPPPRDPPAARTGTDKKPRPDLDALTPGPAGTGWLEALPDDDPADLTWGTTGAARYLGMPSRQYVDELFEKHAEATP
jgi:hypothetical protein